MYYNKSDTHFIQNTLLQHNIHSVIKHSTILLQRYHIYYQATDVKNSCSNYIGKLVILPNRRGFKQPLIIRDKTGLTTEYTLKQILSGTLGELNS